MSEANSPIPTSTLEYYHSLPEPVGPPRERYWLHVLLLVATCFTTLVVGARMEFNFLNNLPPFAAGDEWLPFFPMGWIAAQPARLLLGIPFSATLLAILFAHEMGHYLFCRYYGVRATLPFFIPAPTLIGTLGAVIRIKAPIRSRAALFVLENLNTSWKFLRVACVLPTFLLDAIYSQVARHRYRIFGRFDVCLMPSPELACRFIESRNPEGLESQAGTNSSRV